MLMLSIVLCAIILLIFLRGITSQIVARKTYIKKLDNLKFDLVFFIRISKKKYVKAAEHKRELSLLIDFF